MGNIIAAIDGSDHALATLGWAEEFARNVAGTTLHIIHACHVPTQTEMFNQVAEVAMKVSRELLDEAVTKVKSVPVQSHLVRDEPVAAVLNLAREVAAEMIVIGSQGSVAGRVLGSVSSGILHRARVPVVMVHSAAPRRMERVMVGVDGSDHSARALQFVRKWAPGALITAMHVFHVPEDLQGVVAGAQGTSHPWAGSTGDRAARELIRATLAKAGLEDGAVNALAAGGNPAEELEEEYGRGAYDLAVVGGQGLGSMVEFFLGSVCQRLLRVTGGTVAVIR